MNDSAKSCFDDLVKEGYGMDSPSLTKAMVANELRKLINSNPSDFTSSGCVEPTLLSATGGDVNPLQNLKDSIDLVLNNTVICFMNNNHFEATSFRA